MQTENNFEVSPRERLLAKIRKLRALSTERGATEAEALQAATLCAKLIAEHNVLQSELEIRTDAKNCIKDAFVAIRSKQAAWTKVCVQIERIYGTICWYERLEEDSLGLGFTTETHYVWYYGFPLDVTASITTLAICANFIDTEIANLPKRTKKLERESFELGLTVRINERLREIKQRNFAEAKGKGALVVLKEKLVEEEFSKLGIRLHRTRAKDRKIDPFSYAKGRSAAEGLSLSQGIERNAQRALTGS